MSISFICIYLFSNKNPLLLVHVSNLCSVHTMCMTLYHMKQLLYTVNNWTLILSCMYNIIDFTDHWSIVHACAYIHTSIQDFVKWLLQMSFHLSS